MANCVTDSSRPSVNTVARSCLQPRSSLTCAIGIYDFSAASPRPLSGNGVAQHMPLGCTGSHSSWRIFAWRSTGHASRTGVRGSAYRAPSPGSGYVAIGLPRAARASRSPFAYVMGRMQTAHERWVARARSPTTRLISPRWPPLPPSRLRSAGSWVTGQGWRAHSRRLAPPRCSRTTTWRRPSHSSLGVLS